MYIYVCMYVCMYGNLFVCLRVFVVYLLLDKAHLSSLSFSLRLILLSLSVCHHSSLQLRWWWDTYHAYKPVTPLERDVLTTQHMCGPIFLRTYPNPHPSHPHPDHLHPTSFTKAPSSKHCVDGGSGSGSGSGSWWMEGIIAAFADKGGLDFLTKSSKNTRKGSPVVLIVSPNAAWAAQICSHLKVGEECR